MVWLKNCSLGVKQQSLTRIIYGIMIHFKFKKNYFSTFGKTDNKFNLIFYLFNEDFRKSMAMSSF
jgi:hypothetical protein